MEIFVDMLRKQDEILKHIFMLSLQYWPVDRFGIKNFNTEIFIDTFF